jgi:hypothetical protein
MHENLKIETFKLITDKIEEALVVKKPRSATNRAHHPRTRFAIAQNINEQKGMFSNFMKDCQEPELNRTHG